MMLCEKCKKQNASFFYEESINGKTRSYALCQDCAAEMQKSGELPSAASLGEDMSFASPFTALHDSLFGSLFGLPMRQMPEESAKTCPVCGSSFEDFARTGKAGCPTCYRTFAEELNPTIRSLHGNAKHTGRAPRRLRAKHEKEDRLNSLRKQLKDAISTENFEKAADLRDQIKGLESNL